MNDQKDCAADLWARGERRAAVREVDRRLRARGPGLVAYLAFLAFLGLVLVFALGVLSAPGVCS